MTVRNVQVLQVGHRERGRRTWCTGVGCGAAAGGLQRAPAPASRRPAGRARRSERGVGVSGTASRQPVPQIEVVVQHLAQLAVEGGLVGALEHHRQVVAVRPVGLVAELGLHHRVEPGAGQRIADADADVVRQVLAHQPHGRQDVVEGLAGVAELEEEAGADAGRAQAARALDDLLDLRCPCPWRRGSSGCRSRRPARPRRSRRGRARRPPRSVIRSARDWIVNGMRGVARRHLARPNSATHCGCRPKMSSANQMWSGRQRALDQRHLLGHVGGRAHGVALAPDRLRAPVAVERAAARGDHVQAEVAVRRGPGRAVALDVDEIPGRERKDVGVALGRAPACGGRRPGPADRAGARPATASTGWLDAAGEGVEQLAQRVVRLAGQGVLDAAREVQLGVIGHVRARGEHGGAALARQLGSCGRPPRARARGTSC